MFKTHFWRTLIFGLVGLIIGLIVALVSPKIYEANVELLIGERAVSGSSLLDPTVQRLLDQGSASDSQTELQLLRSQSVFFTAFRDVVTARNMGESKLASWIQYYLQYEVESAQQRANMVDQGGVALIRVRAEDRELAREIADAITKSYNELRTTNARSSTANAVRFLDSQVVASKNALDLAEKSYKDFTNTSGITDITITVQAAQQQYNIALQTLNQLRQSADGAAQEAALLQGRLASEPDFVPGTGFETKSTKITQLEGQLVQLRSELEGLRTRYYDSHPRVKEVLERVRKTDSELRAEKGRGSLEESQSTQQRNSVKETLRAQLATVEARRDSFQEQVRIAEAQLAELSTKLKELPGQEGQLRQLRRDLEVADSNYRRVKTQFDDLNNRQEVITRSTTVLSDAQAFRDPVAPDTAKFVFIGLIAGLCIGLIFSFAVESLRIRVHNSALLAELTGLPVVATVPKLKGAVRSVATLANPGAKPAESFRHMAYAMTSGAGERPAPKMVIFTGVGNVPGRASSSLQFAMSMAAAGSRVLLVDADPLRGLITKAFSAEGRSGVSEIFERTTLPGEGADVFIPTVHDNLTLLPTGADTSRTLADRTNAQVAAFIRFIADKFDIVVLDLPPCDLYADASRLAALVDEVCLVVSASQTNYQSIPAAYDILNRAGAKHVSLILTDASPNDEPFGDSRRYGRTA